MDFKDIFDDQLRFNRECANRELDLTDPRILRERNNYLTLALNRESVDALDSTDWKTHRNECKSIIESNHQIELIDVLKYWMSIWQLNGYQMQDIYKWYFHKSRVVEQMHKQEIAFKIREDDKVVGVDIDGVLANYISAYVGFINQELGTSFNPRNVTSLKIGESLGIDKRKCIELKDKYRQSGIKARMPVCDGARELLATLKSKGYKIVILTARPSEQYQRIVGDTLEWLESNSLPFDAILFDEKKEERLLKEFGDNVTFFIDDMPSNANSLSDIGVKTFLVSQPYNLGIKLNENVERVDDLYDLINKI